MRTHLCGELRIADVGERVLLCGWVAARREHGEHLAFVDLRDFSGVTQCVVDGSVDVRSEWVLQVEGTVRRRPEGRENDKVATGQVELGDCTVETLAKAEPPPFSTDDRIDIDEAVRLRHRYVDLRRPRMQANLRLRARVLAAMRRSMVRQGFVEVETPLLWTPTPEGAREFAVPSRMHPGDFYVLPQSPQIAKQLLMVSGFDRYFQIARCMRDEDLRADRQFEFSQLDIEMSFAGADEVQVAINDAVLESTEAATGERPDGVDVMTWREAMERFGSDKPDTRFGMELVDLDSVLDKAGIRAFEAKTRRGIRVPDGASFARNRVDGMVERAISLGAKGLAWFKVDALEPEVALTSPLDKFFDDETRTAFAEAMQAEVGDLLLVVADEWRTACSVLGQLRADLGRTPPAAGSKRFLWVTEFPMFEGLDESGRPVAQHHPFTMPHPDDIALMATDPLAVRSAAYDLVLNGWELGSGSVRIHREDIQRLVFDALGITEVEAEERFGFLLGAFRYGAPPHAGFAVGVDRFVALLAGEENIREVIAFPKTQSGADLMTGAPRPLAALALKELHLQARPKGPA
jgi:aspartyl-tRNA synthetase